MSTPTPRTDARLMVVTDNDTCKIKVLETIRAPFARTLEREVNALTAERDQLRAQLHALNLVCGTTDADKFQTWVDRANARAERAEDNLAALEQCHDDNCRGVVQIADELATAKERLRSEAMDDYAAIKDLQRELVTERGKLDWVFQNCKVEANDYTTGNRDVYYVHDREDLSVAMQEDAK